MLFNININQKSAVDLNLNLDLIDLAVFDFVSKFALSENCNILEFENKRYYWISHNLVIKEIPLLGIKTKKGIYNRFDNLVSSGVLLRHPNSQTLGKSFYAFGPNAKKLLFSEYKQKATPMNENSEGSEILLPGAMNESSYDNSIKDNNVNNIKSISNPSIARDVASNSNVNFQDFVDAFNSIANRSFRVNDKIKSALKSRMKDYTNIEIWKAIKKAHKDQYHIDTNFKYLTPEFILRPDKLEKFLNAPEENQVVSKPNIEPEYFSRSELAQRKREERERAQTLVN